MAPSNGLKLGALALVLTALICGFVPPTMALCSGAEGGPEVFITDRLVPTFATLGDRNCLPADFVFEGRTATVAKQCHSKLTEGVVDPQCAGVPIVAQFYNCLANSDGDLVSIDGETVFDVTAMEKEALGRTNDTKWIQDVTNIFASCKRLSPAKLTPTQQAVDTYTCLKWRLFASCDQQQSEQNTLDEDGKLRYARFLAGDCPLSPSSLLDAFGLVTGKTWKECSQGFYTGDNASQLYDAELARVTCLLQNFISEHGKVHFPNLLAAIVRESVDDGRHSNGLQKLLEWCAATDATEEQASAAGKYKEMTAEEFTRCWARKGIFSCTAQSNELALHVPEACKITV